MMRFWRCRWSVLIFLFSSWFLVGLKFAEIKWKYVGHRLQLKGHICQDGVDIGSMKSTQKPAFIGYGSYYVIVMLNYQTIWKNTMFETCAYSS